MSIDPVDWGVNGACVEAGESSDIGGGRGRAGGGSLIGRECVDTGGCRETDEEQRRVNERTVRWKLGGKREEI